ncbi:unnamed protein product, partial [Pocillopora meandrina]
QTGTDIFEWKAHIARSVNQEAAKQDQLKTISTNQNCALVIMDWAMKFLQLKYREKQSDWFGKRGLSWHISTTEKPHITWVYLRSDEAGCYHNNPLIAAARGIGKRVGLEVCRYDFSEPQYGKDVCNKILCLMKTCIRRFCNEAHDILSAGDMRRALSERPVKGTSACFCEVDEAKITLEVNKIDGFSKLHNVQFEEKDWADRFTTLVNVTENEPSESNIRQSGNVSITALHTALHRPRAGSIRLTDKVKKYLTAKFDPGEQSGLKADPQQVSNDMRKTRDEQNRRLFERDGWLTKSQ